MKKKTLLILTMLCGILLSIAPFTFSPVCAAAEKIMKCNWTARAELGVGIIIAILSFLSLLPFMKNYAKGMNLAILLNGILALLLPTVLIGVCKSSQMCCRTLAQPALIVLSTLIVVFASLNLLLGIAFGKRK